ncbi:bifunctional glutamate N-acetyltransferase/amino-acid acetyltransferase ArgJ [Desulfonatronum thioautotrophicum]|uniref:bifunctional glutamate N-acetyltransferase/amino-acid acetyltransferase ArgJ n=1 Tax=Desulfonatronum thioautotrophicum TaxID=617001 RepID=UPI000AB2115F|nr:bifunctional glutamate N-acetyltransferase/amino-acid acetyltransferase ArgJ [Desulfonatronum thioautotrophicum]
MIPVPQGFEFAVAAAGFKYPQRNDLTVIRSETPCVWAAALTRNLFQAAPVLVVKEMLTADRPVRAMVVNAGQANACTGAPGLADCRETLDMTAKAIGLFPEDILPASTGVIGDRINLDRWKKALFLLRESLGSATALDAARAIMTTDSFPKLAWRTLKLESGEIRILGMAKGAGMICPNMATMLGFVICDAKVGQKWWRSAVSAAVDHSFNRITVDGDTSTNDCVLALANGMAGQDLAEDDLAALATNLNQICGELAGLIVQDAEGGTKVIHIRVHGAKDDRQADLAARAVGHSPLVKTAMYGQDPNWGRIVAALGRSGAEFDPNQVDVALAGQTIFQYGAPVPMDWDSLLAAALRRQDIQLEITLGNGPGHSTLLASDLTEEYIRINAKYRT